MANFFILGIESTFPPGYSHETRSLRVTPIAFYFGWRLLLDSLIFAESWPTMPPLFVLYGSATGNAEHIAKDIAGKFQPSPSFDSVLCVELDQFKKKCLPTWEQPPPADAPYGKYGIVVVTSTTGNGDAPENADRFVRFIKRKTTPKDTFQHYAFAVLGLGDTNYDQFCAGELSGLCRIKRGEERHHICMSHDTAYDRSDLITLFDSFSHKLL